MAGARRIEVGNHGWRDDRGWGLNPLKAAGLTANSLGNLHVVLIKPGQIRGNHFHPNACEWILICGGPARILWRSDPGHPAREIRVRNKEPLFYKIPAHVEHAIENRSAQDIYAVVLYDCNDFDTIRCPSLIESALKKKKLKAGKIRKKKGQRV